MAETRFSRLEVGSVRVCSQCGSLVYDRDDAENAHRNWHEGVVTGDTLLELSRALDRG